TSAASPRHRASIGARDGVAQGRRSGPAEVRGAVGKACGVGEDRGGHGSGASRAGHCWPAATPLWDSSTTGAAAVHIAATVRSGGGGLLSSDDGCSPSVRHAFDRLIYRIDMLLLHKSCLVVM
ncbi:unnamed protein product, partial [Urochloa humidicola]